jgi:hypothetical protein
MSDMRGDTVCGPLRVHCDNPFTGTSDAASSFRTAKWPNGRHRKHCDKSSGLMQIEFFAGNLRTLIMVRNLPPNPLGSIVDAFRSRRCTDSFDIWENRTTLAMSG